MVHNGIEYGLMAAYAEGLNILASAGIGLAEDQEHNAETAPMRDPEEYQYQFDLAEITEVWRRGTVIRSWLVDLTANALFADPDPGGLRGPGVGLRRGPLDLRGRHRDRRPRPRADLCPVRALQLPGPGRLRRPRPVRPAQAVRRPQRTPRGQLSPQRYRQSTPGT